MRRAAFRRTCVPPFRALIAVALLATAPACAAKDRPGRIPLHVGGRAVIERDGSIRFGWPGVYFEGRFKGTGLNLVLRNGSDRLRLLIDGVEKGRFERPGSLVDARFDGLRNGEHSFRLEKMGESQTDASVLIGVYPIDGRPLPPSDGSARKIEFIGDSYTVGYGNTSPVRTCTRAEVQTTTDTQQAFGPIAARHFGAQYRVNAYSGFGVVRNYDGSRAGESMPGLYPRLIPGQASPVETGRGDWHPQIIVINLGTNDFSTALHAGERWPDEAALRSDYRDRYTAFARRLLADQPQALLILMASDGFAADVDQVAATLRKTAPARVATLRFAGLDLSGCDWHPSLKDHRHLANLLRAEIERLRPPGTW